jgi:hypothetical protein
MKKFYQSAIVQTTAASTVLGAGVGMLADSFFAPVLIVTGATLLIGLVAKVMFESGV